MASNIRFSINNLDVNIYGVGGYIDRVEYKNLDPVVYVFQLTNSKTKERNNYFFKPSTTYKNIEGFRRQRTNEVYITFSGAYFPNSTGVLY